MTISIDDQRLVESYQAGDTHAFDDLVRAHGPSLLGHAIRRLNDRSAAEDAVQETFVRAYRALPRFDGDYRLGPWLHRILNNVCIDEGNRRRREAEKFDRFAADPFAADVSPGVEDELGLDINDTGLIAALESLPPTYREALALRFVQEMSYDELAQVAGVTEQNARARVSRARNAARAALRGVAAIPVLLIPALRRTERVAAAADHYRTGSHANTVSHVAPALAPATDAIAAAAPAATPLLTKAIIGLGLVATVAIPTAGPDLVERGRAVGSADTSIVEAPAPAPAPVAAAPVVESEPSAAPADPTEGIDDAAAELEATAGGLDGAEVVVPLPALPADSPSGGESGEVATPVAPVPVARPEGQLSVTSFDFLPTSGPERADVIGDVTLTVGEQVFSGLMAGSLDVTVDEATGVRQYSGLVLLVLNGGDVSIDLRLEIRATPHADQAGKHIDELTHFELIGQYVINTATETGLADTGLALGVLDTLTQQLVITLRG